MERRSAKPQTTYRFDPRTYWTPDRVSAFDRRLETTFPDLAAEGIRHAMGIKAWVHAEANEYRDVVRCAREEGWRVVCEQIFYRHSTDDRGYIVFMTELGEMRYYSTTEFARLLPESWTRANAVDTWKTLEKPRLIDPLIIAWSAHKRDDGSEYLMVDGVESAEQLDAILNGDAP